ncbi:MAG TPA: nuclear transport factor 2 family protein [Gammaproteobacteria bacterium]|jgi:ketosteroid isomerase-like protein
MRKLLLTLMASSLLGAAAAPVSLVQNEYDFAARVAQKGLREGFLHYLDKQAITLSPKPVNDYDATEKAKPSSTSAKLTWYPSWALVSASGDFGVDTGPWTYADVGKDGKPDMAYGDWLTVWKRGKDGQWKALFDSGIDHGAMSVPVQGLAHDAVVPQLKVLGGPVPATVDLQDQLVRAEEVFSNNMMVKGPREAYQDMGTDDLRLMQEDHAPVVGKPAVLKAADSQPVSLVWKPSGGSVAPSGDLGYLYGMTYASADEYKQQKPLGSFMHVWRRSADGWKLLIAMDTPFPPAK